MGTKKKRAHSDSDDDLPTAVSTAATSEPALPVAAATQSLKPMERKKQRKALDKKKKRRSPDTDPETLANDQPTNSDKPSIEAAPLPSSPPPESGVPALHVSVFNDLSSSESSVREAAALSLAAQLRDVQNAYEKLGEEAVADGGVRLEADKDDGLESCAPSLRYALRRLIRGVSSSRACARQGFALGLTTVLGTIPAVKVDPLMKLIVGLLEVSSSMKGQEAKDCLLGRLFAYGSLARSGQVTAEWLSDNTSSSVSNFISHAISLANKKRYLREPAVSVILDMVDKLPSDALLSQVLEAPGVNEWFQNAAENGDPDVLFLALKLQERAPMDRDSGMFFAKLIPYPFNFNLFFIREHLLILAPCFKESTFCTPRVHSLWPLLVRILVQDIAAHDENAVALPTSIKKHKRSRKSSSFEDITKNVRNFCEVVIDESLLQSSHDRKHLALNVLLLLLPQLPASCVQFVLSHILVNCLVDNLSTKDSWLHKTAQHFLNELLMWASNDDSRRIGVIISLQKHTNGRFDYLTKTRSVKELVSKFSTSQGCVLFLDQLMSLFIDEGVPVDEPSDQSQTTDENSEIGSMENTDIPVTPESMDFLKVWVIDTMPRILKTIKLESFEQGEKENHFEAKFRVQTKILKFLSVQGLFSASLGTEVTSLELQETFKWPKAASSSSLRRTCIEQLQSLLEDAQNGEELHVVHDVERTDLGSYFMRILNILCNFPSVLLYRSLNNEDEKAFKKLQVMESRLFLEEKRLNLGLEARKLHALRYLLIQLLLQVLLHPGQFHEAASELVICCKKAFPAIAHADSSEDEDHFDDNAMPELMDVLVDTLLSILPQSSAPLTFAVEQVFRFFCDNITSDGLLQMLRIVKKDLKPARHQALNSDSDTVDDDNDDFLGVEEAEETDEVDTIMTADTEVATAKYDEENSERSLGVVEVTTNDENLSASDESDGGLDDDAMFRVESHLARLFKERKLSSGNENANSQLVPFKLRVLSLLGIYLQRNPGNPQVWTISSYLVQAFVRAHVAGGSQQLIQRIGAILQKKIFKAKDHPKGDEIPLSSLEAMMEKSLKSISNSRHKEVAAVSQSCTFWILKIIRSRKFPESELKRTVEIFENMLVAYFGSKKSRLKSGFVKEAFRRNPWLGSRLFGFLVEKCGSSVSEFRRVEALDMVDWIMNSWKDETESRKSASRLLKKHIPALCDLIGKLLSQMPNKQSRCKQVVSFCTVALRVVSMLKLKQYFLKALSSDAISACESKLGKAFLPFKVSDQLLLQLGEI